MNRELTKLRPRRQGERQKAISLMSKTTTLHVHHAFLYISLPSLHNYDVKWPNFKFTWERERQGDKYSTISVWTRTLSPLFNFNQNSLLLSNRANWDSREKVLKGCEVYFSATFSWTSPLSDGNVPNECFSVTSETSWKPSVSYLISISRRPQLMSHLFAGVYRRWSLCQDGTSNRPCSLPSSLS